MKRALICDIDGCLNNIKNIAHLYWQGRYTDFDNLALSLPPNRTAYHFLKSKYKEGYKLFFVTGRNNPHRYETLKILSENLGHCNFELDMRIPNNPISSKIMKEKKVIELMAKGYQIEAIEDREDIKEMYNKYKIVTFVFYPDYIKQTKPKE